ncbi:MAG: Na(+)/H(+) antiporter subunit D [Hydrogenophilales bacterium]
MINFIHPSLFLLLGVIFTFVPFFNKKLVLLLFALISFLLSLFLNYGASIDLNFLSFELQLFRVDFISKTFVIIFTLITLIASIYALNQKSILELRAAYLYVSAAIGAVLSGDLISLFVFWELMAIGSTLVILSNTSNKHSESSGLRYLLIHLLGGVILMVGIIGYASIEKNILFSLLNLENHFSWLILAGFLINAGAPPFAAWVADAYPEASFSGTVFLSAFTTKTSVYALIRGFAGSEILIYFGLVMIFYGIIYALLENDIRRILAYSIVNQVGFMLVGIGIGTQLSINGAITHAFAHIIYKALLLMSAGSVIYMTQKRRCTDVGGLYRTMPITTICGIIGALAISSFPLTSGFTTKSMIVSGAAYEHLFSVWILLVAASAGVFLHAGIKFPWFVFFQKDSGLRPKEPPKNMLLAMVLLSFLCILFGIFPNLLYQLLPFDKLYIPYTSDHVIFQLQLLLFAGLAFFVMLPWLKRTLTITLDFDWFYRVGLIKFLDAVRKVIYSYNILLSELFNSIKIFVQNKINVSFNTETGVGKNHWMTGNMVFALSIILLIYLLVLLF